MLHNNNGNKNNADKELTHIAWAYQRRRKFKVTQIVPLEIGLGRIEPDGTPIMILDREPKGGYGSYDAEIRLLPRGVDPRVKTSPTRPEQSAKDSDQSDENFDPE
jgi:hypothetical protein